LTISCRGCEDASVAETLHTDVAGLGSFVDLPRGVNDARWVFRPLSPKGAGIGPTDYEMFATVSLDPSAWGELESDGGIARNTTEVRLPESVASSFYPPNVLRTLPRDGEFRVVCGPSVDMRQRARMPYRGETGARFGDALVFVVATQ
jgi:hypothetical protein